MNASKIAILVTGVLFSSSAMADWTNNGVPPTTVIPTIENQPILDGITVSVSKTEYVAVDADGNYVPRHDVNNDGTFEPDCNGCTWRLKTPEELADATSGANDSNTAQMHDPSATVTNQVTGNSTKLGIGSAEFSNSKDGSKTTITSNGVSTSGEVTIKGVNVHQTLTTHNDQIGALEGLAAQQGATLNAHSALLSDHSARLDEHAKGLAIAMAMPDAWLSDKKRFGIFGAVGGFGDETGIGFATIGRLDDTWTINGKLGSDTEFDQFGWQVGFGAQW